MKKIIYLLVVLSITMHSCGDDSSSDTALDEQITDDSNDDNPDGQDESDGDNSGVSSSTKKIYDANDVFLGNASSVTYNNIALFTTNGYIVSLDWNGDMSNSFESLIRFTDVDGQGTLYLVYPSYYFNSKATFKLYGKYYTFGQEDKGVAITDASVDNTTMKSYYDISDKVLKNYDENSSNQAERWSYWYDFYIDQGYSFYKLKEITLIEIGLPATIVTPIEVKFD